MYVVELVSAEEVSAEVLEETAADIVMVAVVGVEGQVIAEVQMMELTRLVLDAKTMFLCAPLNLLANLRIDQILVIRRRWIQAVATRR